MLSIARRTAIGAALLMIMPGVVWVSGWKWQPDLPQAWLKLLYWVTESVTQPWGIITHTVLCGWFLWCLRFRLRAAVMLFVILGAAILLGQGIKSWIKEQVQEPRPFVVWLEKSRQVPVDQFYALKRKERANWCMSSWRKSRIFLASCASTGRKRPVLLFRPGTRCLQPAGHCWVSDCCGRGDAGSPSPRC